MWEILIVGAILGGSRNPDTLFASIFLGVGCGYSQEWNSRNAPELDLDDLNVVLGRYIEDEIVTEKA